MGSAVGTHSVFATRTANLGGRAGNRGIRCTSGQARLACRAAAVPGGHDPADLRIDVDGEDVKVKRWSVAVTLSGGLSSPPAAERVFGVLAAAGLAGISQLRHVRTAARHLRLTSARPRSEGSGYHALLPGRPGLHGATAGQP